MTARHAPSRKVISMTGGVSQQVVPRLPFLTAVRGQSETEHTFSTKNNHNILRQNTDGNQNVISRKVCLTSPSCEES